MPVITDPEKVDDTNLTNSGKFFVYNIFITLASIIGIIILVGLVVFVLRALGISISLG